MGFYQYNGNCGGSGGISVPSDQIFDTEPLRDNYFAVNPSKLVDGAQCIVLTNPPEGLYQVYTSGAWQDRTQVVVGPKGNDPFKTVSGTSLGHDSLSLHAPCATYCCYMDSFPVLSDTFPMMPVIHVHHSNHEHEPFYVDTLAFCMLLVV